MRYTNIEAGFHVNLTLQHFTLFLQWLCLNIEGHYWSGDLVMAKYEHKDMLLP